MEHTIIGSQHHLEEEQEFYPSMEEVFQGGEKNPAIPVCLSEPVRIQELPKKSAGFQGFTLTAGISVKVVEKDAKRAKATLLATNQPILLGGNQQMALTSNAFILPVGIPLVIENTGEIWATASVNTAVLSVLNEQWSW